MSEENIPFPKQATARKTRELIEQVLQQNLEGAYQVSSEELVQIVESVVREDGRVSSTRTTNEKGWVVLIHAYPAKKEMRAEPVKASPPSTSDSNEFERALENITRVEAPIKPSKSFAHQCWATSGLDALILSPCTHDGKLEEIARSVYHRLSARLIATHAARHQGALLKKAVGLGAFGSICIFLCLFGAPVLGFKSPNMAAVLGLAGAGLWIGIPVALFIYAFQIKGSAAERMRELPIAKCKEEAKGTVGRCFLRVVPASTPEDLKDVWRHGWFTNEGRPISSEIVDTDATSMVAGETANGWLTLSNALLLLALMSFVFPPLLVVAFFLISRGGWPNPGTIRSMEMDRRKAVEGPLLVAAGGVDWTKHQEMARIQQIAEGLKDTTPLLHLGTATGILAGRGDTYAPSSGLPFLLSLKDLQNHLLVVGGTGSGKTSGVLRPIAHQIAKQPGVGLVVMDGKAALPQELRSLPGMQVIDPATARFSLVAGLSPSELVDTLVDVLSSGSETDPFWKNSAAGLLRRAAAIAKHVGGEWWTLEGIGKLATSTEAMDEVKGLLSVEDLLSNPLLDEAMFFFAGEWANLDPKPRSSIMAHAMNWLATLTAHPDLLAWSQTKDGEDSFDLMAPLKGGRMGFLIPAHRYGRAGAAVTALLKARLYSKLKARAENGLQAGETPLVFLIDEAQEVATKDDATMLSIGRSLGLAMVGATQTVEGVTDKLGETAAAKWLAVYGNAIALTGRSHATDEFMAKRAGSVWKAAVSSVPGISVKDSITSSVFSGSVAVSRKQETMRAFATVDPSPITPFLEKSRQAQAHKTFINPDPRYQREPDEGLSSTVSPVPLVLTEELSTLLAEPNLALAITVRARVPRRDVIKLTPMFSKI